MASKVDNTPNDTDISVDVVSLNIVGSWIYSNVSNENCTLCKQHILAPSSTRLHNGFSTMIHVGKCTHCFHEECISHHLKKKNVSTCPICHTPWNLAEQYCPNKNLVIENSSESSASTESTNTTNTTTSNVITSASTSEPVYE